MMISTQTALLEREESAQSEALLPPTTRHSRSFVDDEKPADEVLLGALSRLRLLVIRRDDEPVNEAAQNLFYIELLSEYPLSIAISVLHAWPRQSKYWPAWLELEEAIELAIATAEESGTVKPAGRMKLIVKDGHTWDFAEAAIASYRARIARPFSQTEKRELFRQCLAAATGQVDEIALDGGPLWLVADLREHLPHYDYFASSFGHRSGAA